MLDVTCRRARRLLPAGLYCLCAALPGGAAADEPIPPEVLEANAELAEFVRLETQAGQRVERSELPVLDAAIFTDISPYAAEQTAVRLPAEQTLD